MDELVLGECCHVYNETQGSCQRCGVKVIPSALDRIALLEKAVILLLSLNTNIRYSQKDEQRALLEELKKVREQIEA